jgi:uncharacterized protein with von Willebrand factor type A (vWA) domain
VATVSRYRYGAWAGGGDPLAPPFDVRAALDEVGRDVLAGSGLREALTDLLRRGTSGRRGLDALADAVRRRRAELRRRGDLGGVLEQVRQLLDEAVSLERAALDRDPSPDAALAHAELDDATASGDTARTVQQLQDYQWRDPDAAAAFQRIGDLLRQEVLDQQFAGLRRALSGQDGRPDPEMLRRTADMLADLNQLLEAHARGENTREAFAEFMRRHGDLFPEQPEDVDELLDALARRAAAAERLMRSLSPEQRDELARLVEQALGDADLASEMARLRDNLRSLRPGLDWTSRARVKGDRPLSYGEATSALEELADLDALADQMGQDYPGATLDDVDVEAVERNLGERAAADVRALQQLERELQRQGWLRRDAGGLGLTPKALRRLGETALRKIFADLEAAASGDHERHDAGAAGDPTGSWRRWQHGDEQPIDPVRTVTNALLRDAGSRPPTARPVPRDRTLPAGAVLLAAEDFAVVETERRASAAVALCVDLSFSMLHEGRWGPMKQTALALSHLVATRFRQDALQIVGFHRWARRLTPVELAGIEPEWIQGTNLHHALLLAGRHLRRHPDAEPVVLVVTDGEPTAHLDDSGEPFFWWPPAPQTLRRTVHEVDALTRYGASVNLFLLGDDPGLRRFSDALVRRNGGRLFTPSPDRLGEYVVADYLRSRRGRRARPA